MHARVTQFRQLGDWLASPSNDDWPPLLCHLVDQEQTIGFELRCGDVSVVHSFLPLVISI